MYTFSQFNTIQSVFFNFLDEEYKSIINIHDKTNTDIIVENTISAIQTEATSTPFSNLASSCVKL